MSADKMPPLPEPAHSRHAPDYTADQMHAYARAYAAEQTRGLVGALQDLLDRYVGLVNSGDAGNWNPETEDEVISARAALAKTAGGAQ